jgi:hypothetical protein
MMERLGAGGAPTGAASRSIPRPMPTRSGKRCSACGIPERRLLDEFFWFWPREFGRSAEDPA